MKTSKPKHYALTMLPYPSGDLHVGHWYPMTPSDTRARFMRMNGYRVFFPGFDAFGLPAENAAIQRAYNREWTYANIERMRVQLRQMGAMFDFDSQVVTCDPEYYRWNQWFFLKFFEKDWRTAQKPRRLVPQGQHDAGTGAGHRSRQALRAVRNAGYQEEFGPVALQDHRLRRGAAGLLEDRLAQRVQTLQRNWIGA